MPAVCPLRSPAALPLPERVNGKRPQCGRSRGVRRLESARPKFNAAMQPVQDPRPLPIHYRVPGLPYLRPALSRCAAHPHLSGMGFHPNAKTDLSVRCIRPMEPFAKVRDPPVADERTLTLVVKQLVAAIRSRATICQAGVRSNARNFSRASGVPGLSRFGTGGWSCESLGSSQC